MNKAIAIIDKNTQVQKYTAMIHITNSLSLSARKCLNVLIKNSQHTIEEDKWHKIELQTLIKWVNDGKSYSTKHVKKILNELQTTLIQWNIFEKDKAVNFNSYKSATLIPDVDWNHDEGVLSYRFSQMLIHGLFIPAKIYAKINLFIQKDFKNKHAIVLWEYFIEKLCTLPKDKQNLKTITTEYIAVGDLRLLLGLEKDEYQSFNDLNTYILKKAIAEINLVSEIDVKIEYKRLARKINSIRFEITKKDNYEEFHPKEYGQLTNEVKDIDNLQENTPINQVNDPEKQKLITRLVDEFGVSQETSNTKVNHYDNERILQAIEYAKDYSIKMKKNVGAGFVVRAIDQGWKIQKITADIEKEQIATSQQERKVIEAQILKEYEAFEGLEPVFMEHVQNILKNYFNAMHYPWIAELKIKEINSEKVLLCIAKDLYYGTIQRNIPKLQEVFEREFEGFFEYKPKSFEVVLWKEY